MTRIVAIALLCGGCRTLLGFDDVSPQVGDAGTDTAPIECETVSATCIGDTLRICTALGVPAVDTVCGWGCVGEGGPHCGQLVPGGGLPMSAADSSTFGSLELLSLSALTVDSNDGSISGAADGFEFAVMGNAGVFRMAELRITGGVTNLTGMRPIVFVSNGPVTLDGTLDARGCQLTTTAGPGGFPGGGANQNGIGSGAGIVGEEEDGSGGGGHGGSGGDGGGNSGGQGGVAFGDATITSLVGGGGGAGGVGGANAGRGGGGGGAIQIVSNTRITINASGGINAGGCGATPGLGGNDRGGGGGAGGTILLEAPVIEVTGALAVNGGGGAAASLVGGADGRLDRSPAQGGNGGDGAAGATVTGSPGAGGGSGGGAIGRIRFNTRTGSVTVDNATLSPALDDQSTCTQGVATVR